MDIDLSHYDFIIATPPCNYYSRARGNRKPSDYAIKTKKLLPGILTILSNQQKPFIVENVRNASLFIKMGLFDLPDTYIYLIGRHTYWTNIPFNFGEFKQDKDDILKKAAKQRQGGRNVHLVIEYWLERIGANI